MQNQITLLNFKICYAWLDRARKMRQQRVYRERLEGNCQSSQQISAWSKIHSQTSEMSFGAF